MNKMDGVRAGIAEMRSVAQRLNQWADDMERSFQAREAPPGEAPAADAVQPEPGAEKAEGPAGAGGAEAAVGKAAEAKKEPTLPEVRAILAGKCAAGFGTQVKALIESYGASSLKEVPAEKYEELLEAVGQLGGDADAG